jgi:glycosyltransferase involved in cell wall biosynthesis
VEAERFDPKNTSSLRAPYYRFAQRLEQKAMSVADAVICTGLRDEERFRHRYHPDVPVIVAPNGVPKTSIKNSVDDATVDRLRETHSIDTDVLIAVFVGSAYNPNIAAARRIIEMAPSLSDRVEFVIIGKVCDELGDVPSNVTTTGYVDDLAPYLSMADVGLNPITTGGGSNIKMLEYFAYELPVITTPFGSRGFEVKDDSEVIVADVNQFVTELSALTPERQERIGRCAFEYVQRRHVWSRISAALHDRLEELFLN